MTLFDVTAKNYILLAARADYTKMTEIAKAVYENPQLLKDFERDPTAAAFAINRFEVPQGMHIHIADSTNKFTPAEGYGVFGHDRQGSWTRIEVRAGYKTFSLVACG